MNLLKIQIKKYIELNAKSGKFKNPKISYIFCETLVLPIICNKCGSNNDTIFKEDESTEIQEVLGLIT